MEIAISILAKIVEYTIAPIGCQVGYLFLYNKNIEHLRARNEELVHVVKELGHRVDEAKRDGCEIEPRVSTWFETANKSITELSNMFQEIESGSNEKCSITWCFGLSKRYQLSRKANKKGKKCSELITIGENFERVGYLVPLSGTSGSFNIPEDYQFLESRTSMVKQIKDALANPNPIFNRIGLFGMGGVGKTMLLHEVEKLVLEDKLFDQVIKVIIGQSIDVKDIQAQLGEKLRMNLVELTESKQGRADLLRNKLQVENKILVMLDDLWNKLDLQDVGIPCRSKLSEKGSKILITSRQRNVLTKDMNIEMCFELNHLSEDESWKVFSAIVGKFDGADYIKNVAEKVAKQCKGLPLALTVVANTLKKEERLGIWKDTLNRLENPTAPEIGGVTGELYSAIKWSYDHIKSTETRSLFLLCSVFPDDYQISVENLQMYAMGMGLLSGVKTWDETRNRVTKLVDDLISSSLLLKSNWGDKYVIMHDVVRDVAMHIASEANMSVLIFGYKHSEWAEEDRRGPFKAIFGGLANFHYLPQDLEFQNLKLLILYGENWNREELQISNTFFEGMKKLTVLDLSNMWLQEPLTHALAENLQIFCMRECKVDDIDIIGKLKKLQVLRIKYCRITHLPATMSELTELKVLEVSDCKDLNVIPQKFFSVMKKLEELDLLESFNSWGEEVSYKNVLMKNVTLEELKFLPRLMSLKLDIMDERMLKDLSLPENFKKFGNFCFHVGDKHTFSREYFERVALVLKIGSEADLINRAFGTLLQRCEHLSIEATSEAVANLRFKTDENGVPSLIHTNPQHVISLFDHKVAFPELKSLKIVGENNSQMVWHDRSLIVNSFCKLQTIVFWKFSSLTYILSSNVVRALVSLNALCIDECESLESIFEIEGSSPCKQKEDTKVMPLKNLYLSRLMKLKCVWNKDPCAFLTFPNLEKVNVTTCPQLQSVFPASFINHVQNLECLYITPPSQVPLQLFSEDGPSDLMSPEIMFSSLKMLEMGPMTRSFSFKFEWFPKVEYLKLRYHNNNEIFFNNERLCVRGFSELVQLFSNEEENNGFQLRSNWKHLSLDGLRELTHVWTGNNGVTLNLDNLEIFQVWGCEKLKCLAPPSITFLNLRFLYVVRCHGLMNLVNLSMAKCLVEIRVSDCREMCCIFAGDIDDRHEIAFSRLKMLEINKLPRLESFYTGKCKLAFPCLEVLEVWRCPTMKMFSHGPVTTPMVKRLRIDGSKVQLPPTNYDINDIFSTFDE